MSRKYQLVAGVGVALLAAVVLWHRGTGGHSPSNPSLGDVAVDRKGSRPVGSSAAAEGPRDPGSGISAAEPAAPVLDPALRGKVVSIYRAMMDRELASGGDYPVEEFDAWRDQLLKTLGPDPLGSVLALLPQIKEDDVAVRMVATLLALADAKVPESIWDYASTVGCTSEIPQPLSVLPRDLEGPLRQLLREDHSRPEMRERILRGLSQRLPQSPGRFEQARDLFLNDPSEAVRSTALATMTLPSPALSTAQRSELYDAARTSLTSGSEALRMKAALALQSFPSAMGILLETAQQDPSADVRAQSMTMAVHLARTAQPENSDEMNDRAARVLLAAVSRDGVDPTVTTALQCMGSVATAGTAKEIYAALTARLDRNEDWTVCRLGAMSLRELAARGFYVAEVRARLQGLADNPRFPETFRAECVHHLASLSK